MSLAPPLLCKHSIDQWCQTPPRFTCAWPQVLAEHLCLHARHALNQRGAEHVLGKGQRNRGRNGFAAYVILSSPAIFYARQLSLSSRFEDRWFLRRWLSWGVHSIWFLSFICSSCCVVVSNTVFICSSCCVVVSNTVASSSVFNVFFIRPVMVFTCIMIFRHGRLSHCTVLCPHALHIDRQNIPKLYTYLYLYVGKRTWRRLEHLEFHTRNVSKTRSTVIV